jgi:acetyl esterase/lipase
LKVRLVHGEHDFSYDTRFKDAETFAEALQAAGYDVALLPQKGSHESFQLAIIDTIVELGAVNSGQ